MSIAGERPYQEVPQTVVGISASSFPVVVAPGAVMALAALVTVPNNEMWHVVCMGCQFDLDVEADFVTSNSFYAIQSPGMKPCRLRADNERQILSGGVAGRVVLTSDLNKFDVGPGRIIATNVSVENVGAINHNVTGGEIVLEVIRYRLGVGGR